MHDIVHVHKLTLGWSISPALSTCVYNPLSFLCACLSFPSAWYCAVFSEPVISWSTNVTVAFAHNYMYLYS